MRCFLIVALVLIGALGCEERTKSLTPDDMFYDKSAPVGDPSVDPYRPETAGPLLTVPIVPPTTQKARGQR